MSESVKVAVECMECGDEFFVTPFFAKLGPRRRKFCTKKCSNKRLGRDRAAERALNKPAPPPVETNPLFPSKAIVHISEEQEQWIEDFGDPPERRWTKAHIVRMAINRLRSSIDSQPLTPEEIDHAFGGRFLSPNRGRPKSKASAASVK